MLDALIGHLVGDFLLQDDWMAAGKKRSSLICLVHVVIYTTCVMIFSRWWDAVGLLGFYTTLAVAIPHFLIDRTRFIRTWMELSDQQDFADKLGPWSLIVVDQVWHLLFLWAVWRWRSSLPAEWVDVYLTT